MNAEELINKGKSAALAGYDMGNGLMNKVPALKSKRNKLIVWGVLGALVAVLMFSMLGGGSEDPFDVAKNTMVALAKGDLETFFENLYWPDDVREEFSKLSEKEVEVLEKELAKGFIESFSDMTEEQQQLMIEAFSSMKCESVKSSGDEAQVEVKLRKIGGGEDTQTYKLKKYDGEWKLIMN